MTKMKSVSKIVFAGVAALLLIVATPAMAEEVAVKIGNFTFGPQELKVKSGTTVTWTNEDDIPHTVTSSTLAFKSKALDSDDKFSFTFTTPGTYPYFCALHPVMTGTIVVDRTQGRSVR